MKTLLIAISTLFFTSNLFAIKIPKNERIDYWINRYTTDLRNHFQSSLYRSELYRDSIIIVFRENNIPLELTWIPLIESGFNCASKSTAKAAGCWQFIPSTGEQYGLQKKSWKDQRYDFKKSTIAAADYFSWLYKIFGNWELAIAAYNAGPEKIKKRIKTDGRDYWNMKLKKETMDYIPKLFAVVSIMESPEKYGFKTGTRDLKTVTLKKGSHSLVRIANVLMIDYEEFKTINPGFDVGYTPPDEETEIYLKSDWNVKLLERFGFLTEKPQSGRRETD